MAKNNFLVIGAALLAGWFLLKDSTDEDPPGDRPDDPDDPQDIPDDPGVVTRLGASVESVEVSQGVVKVLDRDSVIVSVKWTPGTKRDGIPDEWEYIIFAGVGKPEHPFPGRQFDTTAQAWRITFATSTTRTSQLAQIPITSDRLTTGKKDVLVVIGAAPSPTHPNDGDDMSGKWPHNSDWREVASFLVQDAVEVIALNQVRLGADVQSVTVSQRRRRRGLSVRR